MSVLLYLLLFYSPNETSGWRVTPDLYQPLTQTNAAVSENGHTYILDRQESRILHYDAEGNAMPAFGGEGQGPGEFRRAFFLHLLGDRIYVIDFLSVNVFDSEGDFVEKITPPERGLLPRKVQGGWIVIQNQLIRPPGQNDTPPSRLLWFDDGFENQRVIHEWESIQTGMVFHPDKPIEINPSPEVTLMAFSEDGQRAFFRFPGEAAFHIVDGAKGEIIKKVEVPFTRIPFDEEWGKRQVEERKKLFAEQASFRDRKIVAGFPDTFPSISSMVWLAEGALRVSQNAGEDGPKLQGKAFYDRDGNPVKPVHDTDRILAIRGEMAYVTHFDPEEEILLLICHPLAEVGKLLEEFEEAAQR